jgi:hypothetical protein
MSKQESFSPARQHLVGLSIISLAAISCGQVALNDSKNSQSGNASSVTAIAEKMNPITAKLVANTADNSLPILIDAPEEICFTKEYIDRNGDKKTGTKNCSAGLSACSQDGQKDCIVAGNYAAANTTDVASKILLGQAIAGVPGSIANCTAGGSNCFLPPYARNTQPLKAVNYDDILHIIDPWDVRVGVTVNGVPNYGKLKVNCRNRVLTAVYNSDASIDIRDTMDDSDSARRIPQSVVTGWENNDCGGVEKTAGDDNVWKDVTTTSEGVASTCDADADRCTMQDKITRLWWSKSQYANWADAWYLCTSLNHNGQTGWRLPTQKELMEAYIHGIRFVNNSNWITEGSILGPTVWSGSSRSSSTNMAWTQSLVDGHDETFYKSSLRSVVCVR